ncbi:alpha-1,6-mannosyltransferase subunit [Tricharina praecox]|uniref:alpha-1,6-mannosyltransferase subunit n=1 Tax=Tricharina praecox TaxID=43433 RepID=UPI0022203D99|nr:alpha-1,6-mannosyltransferase subunit [Tricharina praecox]KAI5842069.1 alpha-1,6-mannosyltransferase subunit [Tricharina praecox]
MGAMATLPSYLTAHYDHLAFPGAVPRSFVGPLLLSQASIPFIHLFGGSVNEQVIVRGTLGLLSSLALSYYIRRVRLAYGAPTAWFYTLLQLSQFHFAYYASRTLPNTFALIPSVIAHACFLPAPGWRQSTQRNHLKLGIYLLTLATVVFRSELVLLLAFQALDLLVSRRLTLPQIFAAGLAGGIMGLVATLAVDSYFWLSFGAAPIFTTPVLTERFGLLWPEFSAFHFNAVLGSASQWGDSHWHYYFTSALPKLLLNPTSLVLLPLGAFALPHAARALLLPALSFITVYSAAVKHKEWRFIVYTVPQITLMSALAAAWLWNRRAKFVAIRLLLLAVLASVPVSLMASAGMAAVSSFNYPGGEAMQRVHALAVSGNTTGTEMKVHLDVLTCMTGATRFLQEAPLYPPSTPKYASHIVWDKTEDATTLLTPAFWEDVEYALVAAKEKTIGPYEVVDVIRGFGGVRVFRPGDEEGGEGWGLRRYLGGWWVGVNMREWIWIVRRQSL